MIKRKTSALAFGVLCSAIGGPITTKTLAEDVLAWCSEGQRPRLFDFEPAPGKQGIPGLDPESEAGAGGWAALLDLARRVAAAASRARANGGEVTVSDMEDFLAQGTWLCNPDLEPGDTRLAILEASGQ